MDVRSKALAQNLRGRHELRWIAAAIMALSIGTVGARSYARVVIPYYRAVAEYLATGHSWEVVGIELQSSGSGPGAVMRLTGLVRAQPNDLRPSGRVVSKLQVAAVVELPIIFWTLMLVWPAASFRQRFLRVAIGAPVFLALEAATTVCQLLGPLAGMSHILAGDSDPLTSWEIWSRFLEAGGRIVLASTAALFAIAATGQDLRDLACRSPAD